jgi:hypothetical protein
VATGESMIWKIEKGTIKKADLEGIEKGTSQPDA